MSQISGISHEKLEQLAEAIRSLVEVEADGLLDDTDHLYDDIPTISTRLAEYIAQVQHIAEIVHLMQKEEGSESV